MRIAPAKTCCHGFIAIFVYNPAADFEPKYVLSGDFYEMPEIGPASPDTPG
jgi:hypothetical protein